MKRLIATLATMAVLSIAAVPARAQTHTRAYRNPSQSARNTARAYDNRNPTTVYQNDTASNSGYYGQSNSVWNKHRDKITTAGGVVGGALLGSLIGGKKGALIGAITGGAGAAVYTYKIRDKYRQY
ncbi:MAG: hypothetical protein ABI967_14305 [bacterium]